MNRKVLALVAACALLSAVNPSSASVIKITYTGIVTGTNWDNTGMFGGTAAQGSLSNSPFEMVWTFDTALGSRDTGTFYDEVVGGSNYSVSTPGSAILTINGHSVSLSGSYSSFYVNENGNFTEQYAVEGPGTTIGGAIYNSFEMQVSGPAGSIPISILTPYSRSLTSSDYSAGGGFSFGIFGSDQGLVNNTLGSLSPTTLDVTVSGAPLPATLPLFVSGLGALGLLGWRRKRKNAAALAA